MIGMFCWFLFSFTFPDYSSLKKPQPTTWKTSKHFPLTPLFPIFFFFFLPEMFVVTLIVVAGPKPLTVLARIKN